MNSYKKEIICSLDEHDKVVQELKNAMAKCQIFACSGPLGAGKTTTIKALLRNCGVTEPITSPTFTYVNEYKNDRNEHFYHFDLYRINNVEEFQAQGFDEYLYQPQSWSFIEWPEIILPLLTHNVCFVSFDYGQDPDKRVVTIEYK
ncbi:MAG TPA: tRNA (adenosine(37)-N6)-threonylcarbamoyltransferase complex ATPase subunit type 1 TsaE [Candidatus Babeliales bacterium]|jgi:tRNA threonylcarbamoyladenosine biosynthesis protein TsaE|nr:tRNA (adenosine(37)-N6)-threonylcarbamoyltransferase complex ATPase subunit type 1 TsaE [Candidatus Babeliales bacterium]